MGWDQEVEDVGKNLNDKPAGAGLKFSVLLGLLGYPI